MSRSRVWILVVAVMASVARPALAQSFHYGPMLGTSWAGWHDMMAADGAVFPSSYNPGVRTGFVGGGFLRFNTSERVTIEPQLLYVQKGAKFDSAGTTGTVKLDYMEIPVLFKLTMPTKENRVEPSFFAGPAIGFRAGCKVSAPHPSNGASATCGSGEIGSERMDYSAVFGLGLDAWRLAFQLRYDLGLSVLGTSDAGHQVKNKAWLFTVGYRFGS